MNNKTKDSAADNGFGSLSEIQREKDFSFRDSLNIFPFFIAAYSKNPDNISSSSSGGIFYELCAAAFEDNGIVYGAIQKDVTEIIHQRFENILQAKAARRSKYLRSHLYGIYSSVKRDLENGRKVLFSGTGCQIGGLYKYLSRSYSNLITCEVVCHGMPLSITMEKYIKEKELNENKKTVNINFRDKILGWSRNCITETYANGEKDTVLSTEHPVHSLYLKGINMSAGCSECIYQKLPRIADITLADFWQYKGSIKKLNSDKGISLVSVNTEKGEIFFNNIKENIYYDAVDKKAALESCRHLNNSPFLHPSNKIFNILIKKYNFKFAHDICNSFGEIILPNELCIVDTVNLNSFAKIFEDDTQTIVYIRNHKNEITGIITYGEFIKNYGNESLYINKKFKFVRFSENCAEELKEIFKSNNKINRIPVIDKEGSIVFEVRRSLGANGKNDDRKFLLPIAKLIYNKNLCLYVKRPDLIEGYEYSESEKKRIKNNISFSVMQSDFDKYESEFKKLYREKCSKAYINALSEIPPIIELENSFRHMDGISKYVNVINGKRITLNQPSDYGFTIHLYGRCGVFGYAVEDGETVCSYLQNICNVKNKKVRIVNHGLWGADDAVIFKNLNSDIDSGVILKNDIVILYMNYISNMDYFYSSRIPVYDSTKDYHIFIKNNADIETFFDKPGHMTSEGYLFIAEFIYNKINENNVFNKKINHKEKFSAAGKKDILPDNEIREYIKNLKLNLPMKSFINKYNGAIVMNCNPFTKGHRYLAEYAAKKTDNLIIFVLEEDKSYFKFADRFNMVKMGTDDLDNVYVVPSGGFIISSLTFPEYFLKDQNQEVKINAANDIEIFGKYIASELNIKIRFLGTEPIDNVTRQYNEEIKKILPLYGVEAAEIPRLKDKYGYISATEVRKCISANNKFRLAELVPDTTYEYLKSTGYISE